MIGQSRVLRSLLTRAISSFASDNPKPKSIRNSEYAPVDPVFLQALLKNRELNRVLKKPIPSDVVQNPLFHVRMNSKHATRVVVYAKSKIAAWAGITGLVYYFVVNPLWAVLPGLVCLAYAQTYWARRHFMTSQVRRIILLDVTRS